MGFIGEFVAASEFGFLGGEQEDVFAVLGVVERAVVDVVDVDYGIVGVGGW